MFLNVIMLAGIGGAAVPLVLHLLSRARYRSATWGAMMFLQAEDASQRQGVKLRQMILLVTRMALVALLAIALARPIASGRSSIAGAGQNANLTAVILLDNSASMGYGPAGRSRADQARQAVRQVLATLRRGDQAALIVLGDPVHAGPAPAPTADLQSVSDLLDSPRLQTPGYGVADIADGLKLAADVLERSGALRRELVIVCDHQAINWRGVSESFIDAWKLRVGALGMMPRFVVIPVGGLESDNVAIESINPEEPQILVNQPAAVAITIRNYGPIARAAMPLSIDLDNQPIPATTVNVEAGAAATIVENLSIKTVGSHVISARVLSPDAAHDNQLSSAVDVIEPINVLIIRGESAAVARAIHAPDYLKLALMPFASAGRVGPDLAKVQVVSASDLDWSALDSRKFRVVILDNVAALNSSQAQALEQHAYGGGGLLISPGSRTMAGNFDSLLYREGAGVMPAKLSPPTPADASAATTIDTIEFANPIFRFLSGKSEQNPPPAIARYFPAAPRPQNSQVPAKYASGSPMVVTGHFGRGQVVLVTTPLNEEWSNLPRTNFYLPMVQSMVRFLAARPSRNLLPGQPIIAQFDDQIGPFGIAAANVAAPSRKPVDIPLQPAGDQFEGRYTDTTEPGVYTLTTRGQKLQFVVSPPRDEADPTPLTPQRWDEFESELGFTTVDATETALGGMTEDDRSPREFWAILLAAVLALGVVEILLGRLWTDPGVERISRMRFA